MRFRHRSGEDFGGVKSVDGHMYMCVNDGHSFRVRGDDSGENIYADGVYDLTALEIESCKDLDELKTILGIDEVMKYGYSENN